jgi:hypothetical protein
MPPEKKCRKSDWSVILSRRHISEGLGMQFLEEPDKIEMPSRATYDGLCDTWKDFAQGMPYPKEDSGL